MRLHVVFEIEAVAIGGGVHHGYGRHDREPSRFAGSGSPRIADADFPSCFVDTLPADATRCWNRSPSLEFTWFLAVLSR
jgi:hypothetical protein